MAFDLVFILNWQFQWIFWSNLNHLLRNASIFITSAPSVSCSNSLPWRLWFISLSPLCVATGPRLPIALSCFGVAVSILSFSRSIKFSVSKLDAEVYRGICKGSHHVKGNIQSMILATEWKCHFEAILVQIQIFELVLEYNRNFFRVLSFQKIRNSDVFSISIKANI